MQTVRKLRGREIPITHTSSTSRKRKQASQGLGHLEMERHEGESLRDTADDAAENTSAGSREPAGAHGSQAEAAASEPPLSPYSTLQKAYEVIYGKYQRLKERKLEEAERLVEEQKVKTAAYSKAAEELVENLRKDNIFLRHLVEESQIEDALRRVKELEQENLLYKNELLMARAKEYQTDLAKADRRRFLQQLVQSLSQMTVVEEDGSSTAFVFHHEQTGLKFVLEQVGDNDVARFCGGDREVKLKVVSLGTLQNVAPEWMREPITFSVSQASILFNRIGKVANGRSFCL